MKQLDQKYYNLQPEWSYISDTYVLGLAWKKADSFIRSHNWYADLLSMDQTTLNIDNQIQDWVGSVNQVPYQSCELNLIPAPKSAKWLINKKGIWIQEVKERTLRPLADVFIKDQVVSTAITMCVADALESRQRNCSLEDKDYSDHINNKMVSYGNRLLCDWERGIARFRWGGSEFYRKYSSDYRAFLQRPVSIGRDVQQKVSTVDEVYVVHVDLKNFFGSIKINLLFDKLKAIASEHYEIQYQEYSSSFWDKAKDAFNWTWSKESLKIAENLDLSTTIGLPQGLASSGAISNAYLIGFDEEIIKKFQSKISGVEIYLHDYCRYVDDLRFVISGVSLDKQYIKDSIETFVQDILNSDLNQNIDDLQVLEVNHKKTQVFELADLDNSSSLTNRVNELQREIGASCVSDRNTLDSSIPALQQLLQSEHIGVTQDFEKEFSSLNVGSSIKIESVRKFSANRLSSALLEKSKILPENDKYQQENERRVVAKKLILEWLKDPSNMVLFRKAIEINPSISLYDEILNVIFNRVIKNRDKNDKYIMIYLMSDIFRSFIDIYRRLDSNRLKEYKNLFGVTTTIAQKLLSSNIKLPNYIYSQALFYLIVVKQPFIGIKKSSSNIYRLHQVLIKKKLTDLSVTDGFLFEVASQITNDFQTNASFLLSHTSKTEVLNMILSEYAFRGGKFWQAIWDEITRLNNKSLISSYRWAIPNKESKPNGCRHYLSTITNFKDNPFKHEHSLLKLGIELVKMLEGKESKIWRQDGGQLSPYEILIEIGESKSWDVLWKIDTEIECKADPKSEGSYDPRYKTPVWLGNLRDNTVLKQSDEAKVYWICSLLRAAALGNVDYTQRNDLIMDESKYLGIRSQWFKRRMGMLHSPESIVGSFGTISDWFAHLLQHGLQWPGFSSSYTEEKDILEIIDLDSFKKCLKNRLNLLNDDVCSASDIPTIPLIVKRPELETNLFRVVTVQQLFPKDKHFHLSDVQLDAPSIRWKHREHLAEICKLTEQTLSAKLRAESRDYKSTADLIVFSELSVHPDDEDLIRGLALRTKSIVFAGFVFSDHEGIIINKARWIIPDKSEFGMQWRIRDQGKYHMTPDEKLLGVKGYRPCQHVIHIEGSSEGPFKITGAICYDATDIRLAADLRDKTDMFVIAAYNKDVNTFDNMASALQWHMYQHIVIANTGVYGGSTMQAPYKDRHNKLISHAHGASQIAISTADIDLAAFRRQVKEYKAVKTQPAGFSRKH